MKAFAALYRALDESTRTSEKIDALVEYLAAADPADAVWAVRYLGGDRPKGLVRARRLAAWATDVAGVPSWLFEECYETVGDLAETISLLLPDGRSCDDLPLHRWIEERILPLAGASEDRQREIALSAWNELTGTELLVWNKLVTGGFRVGVSRQLVIKALARIAKQPESVVAHRLMGTYEPTADWYRRLLSSEATDTQVSQPYPFYLAYPLEEAASSLGETGDWQAEWKWDGIRAQVVRRSGRTFIWTRGEELVTDRYPELVAAATGLPDGTVLDGEILPWKAGQPLPFAQLQRRIGRKTLGAALLRDVPVVLICYDLLELAARDIRTEPLRSRRASLETVLAESRTMGVLLPSPLVPFGAWEELAEIRTTARDRNAEGLMLKAVGGEYGVGRRRGGWWKWKVTPYTIDAVMMYAQAGHGRRAALVTDYTFGLWEGDRLVPFAKAYSGLDDSEIRELDGWIRRHTTEKFGPVRSVAAEQVFELAFENVQASSRHKSGVAVRFPRIVRWRKDKRPADADRMETLRAMIAGVAPVEGG